MQRERYIAVAVVLALAGAALVPSTAAAGGSVRGCTNWVQGQSPRDARCAGQWFQAGPGADGYGGTLMWAIAACELARRARCTRVVSRDSSPLIGVYIDDTTPCPASLNGAPGTWYSASWEGWFGAPCVQYWVNDERQNNPNHGLIYAAIGYCGCIDGTTDTRFDGADATLVEWYPFTQSSFAGFPPPDEQGYILQYSYDSPRPHLGDILWAWGQAHTQGVLAYY
jgi:hypothetical protein